MTTDETRDQNGNKPTDEQVERAARAYDPEAWAAYDRVVDEVSAAGEPPPALMVEYSLGKARDMLTAAAAGVAPPGLNESGLTPVEIASRSGDSSCSNPQCPLTRAHSGPCAPPAPSADREKLIADSKSKAQKAFPHRNPYLEGGAYMGEERSRLPLREAYARGYVDAADALAAPAPVQIADEAVEKLRGLGLSDAAIRERLAQATMLAAAPVSDELVQVVAKIAAKATLTSEDLHQMEHRGIRVKVQRGPGPMEERDHAMQIAQAIARAHTFTTATAASIAEVAMRLASPVDETKLAEVIEQARDRSRKDRDWTKESLGQYLARVVCEHLEREGKNGGVQS